MLQIWGPAHAFFRVWGYPRGHKQRKSIAAHMKWSYAREEVDAAADYALDRTARHSFRSHKVLPCRDFLDCLSGDDWLHEWMHEHRFSRA